ncbi:MAG: NADH-quinone oxidoreductase subunit M [Cyclobacteriaceae bacterium]
MILPGFIVLLMMGGILAWIASQKSLVLTRWISLLTVALNFLGALVVWLRQPETSSSWLLDYSIPWIPQFGISFHLALDGLSLLMLLLTFFLGSISVLISWKEIQNRVGLYHFCLLWVLAGITGVFLAMDLFLFFFFWEVMLIPMFFLIIIWGHENSRYAAFKFFIFTQASGLLMLVAILGLYFVNGNQTGIYTFDYFQLLSANLPSDIAMWLMLGFLAAFAVKLPVVPFHTWLPDAHSQAPTAGSLILAGLLLKTGAYGLLRFVVPLFRDQAIAIAPWAMAIGVFGIIYGAILAFSQTDLKRLVAYTSVSHMGFIMLGVFSFNELATQGVVMQMITHGISTGALFILAGFIYERIHTRDITRMGGFWKSMPFLGTCGLVFAMASLGLPGLGNFVAEFLTLVGAWQATHTLTIIATLGLVAATIYSLRILQKVFYGTQAPSTVLVDLSFRERLVMIVLVVSILWLGLFPQPMLNTSQPAVKAIIEASDHSRASAYKPPTQPKLVIKRKGGSYE